MGKQHSGQYYVQEAQKNGLKTKNGHGDHCIVYGPADRGYMTVPMHRELATGTECAIRKWFIKLGIVLPLLLGLACWLEAFR